MLFTYLVYRPFHCTMTGSMSLLMTIETFRIQQNLTHDWTLGIHCSAKPVIRRHTDIDTMNASRSRTHSFVDTNVFHTRHFDIDIDFDCLVPKIQDEKSISTFIYQGDFFIHKKTAYTHRFTHLRFFLVLFLDFWFLLVPPNLNPNPDRSFGFIINVSPRFNPFCCNVSKSFNTLFL